MRPTGDEGSVARFDLRDPRGFREELQAPATFEEAFRGRGVTDGLDPVLFSVAPDMVALSLDAPPYLAVKQGVLTAHRSQFALTPERLAAPPPGRAAVVAAAFRPMLEHEVYLLGGSRGPVPRWPLPDAFDGIDG